MPRCATPDNWVSEFALRPAQNIAFLPEFCGICMPVVDRIIARSYDITQR